jgi:hypothetical protein
MFSHRFKILHALVLVVLATSGFIYYAKAQNITAFDGNVTSASPQPVAPVAALSFDRWSIIFQCPGQWKEWTKEESTYAKDALNEQLNQFNIEMLEFTTLMAPNETAAIIISKSQRQNPVIIEELVKERENVYKDAKAAGDVTQVNKLEQTTIDNKPAVVEDVERLTGGRAISMKIVSGQKVFEISVISRDKKDFDSYRPVFEEILKTIRITE